MEMHTLTFTDLEWAVILNTYSTDAAVAEIVRSHAQARAGAANELSNPSSNKNIENTNERESRGVKGGEHGCADGTTIPPDIDSVKAYFKAKGIAESEGEAFWNYWESRGWLTTHRIKLKNWHSAVATWIRLTPCFAPPKEPKPYRYPAQPRRPDNYLPPTEEERKRNASLF